MVLTTRRYTFDEWIDSPDNTMLTELVDGVPVERMSTSSDHGSVIKALWRWLDRAEHAGYGTVHLGPVAVVLDATGGRRNVREPDVCFLSRARSHLDTGKAIEGLPDLVIEVLSPTNRNDDLPGGDVWDDYERFGVPSYWIVDPEARTVTQYTHFGSHFGAPVLLRGAAILGSPLFPGITLLVADLFRQLRAQGR